MARHDQSRLACVGWRSSDLPTAIAPRHPIRVARLGSWHKARAKPSGCVPKVARRRTRLRSWGAGRAVTSPKRRPDDLPRPRSSHLSQIARQISLVPMGAAHRTPTTCHLHRFASSGHLVILAQHEREKRPPEHVCVRNWPSGHQPPKIGTIIRHVDRWPKPLTPRGFHSGTRGWDH